MLERVLRVFVLIAYSQTSFGPPTRMALLGRIEGITTAPVLIEQLRRIMSDHQGVLAADR